MDAGWPHRDSPFHRGEREVQRLFGVGEEIDIFARRMVRDFMPEQHRVFYNGLPFLMLGTVDPQGRPWASLVSGMPGFVTSPDDRTLHIAANPLPGDPLLDAVRIGADIGVLGIELETRRRNRAVGKVVKIDGDGFTIAIAQSFGNCPQYIQTRTVRTVPTDGGNRSLPVARSDRFDKRTAALLENADTFFIASVFRDGASDVAQGADVSHRGGMPGFVRLEDDRTFSFPDFPGNKHFNTLGNIHLNPRAGVLFIDFDAGDLVYMTGMAEIVWNDTDDVSYSGAGRRVRFRAEEVLRVPHGTAFQFTFGDYSPAHRRLALRADQVV